MLTVNEIFSESVEVKRRLLDDAASRVRVPAKIDSDLHTAYKYAQVLEGFIQDYILKAVEIDKNNGSVLSKDQQEVAIKKAIDEFYPKALEELKKALPDKDKLKKNAKNLYEVAGARKLAFGNNATRTLSTTMGLLWEKLANISPYAINPEIEFGIKLKGVDAIYYDVNSHKIMYAQLKTQQNTLTGSQKSRSVSELLLHKNPAFCACFETKSSWTFSHNSIPRLLGREFWSKIGMDYDLVLGSVSNLILRLEDDYVKILAKN